MMDCRIGCSGIPSAVVEHLEFRYGQRTTDDQTETMLQLSRCVTQRRRSMALSRRHKGWQRPPVDCRLADGVRQSLYTLSATRDFTVDHRYTLLEQPGSLFRGKFIYLFIYLTFSVYLARGQGYM